MRSQAIVEFGAPLQGHRNATPTPQGTEVLLSVTDCGVCHSDVHIHDGYFDLGGGNKLPLARCSFPHTLGHEIEGEVVALGPDAKGAKIGDMHAVFPWIGCGQCAACLRNEEHSASRPRNLGCSAGMPGRLRHACDRAASAISARLRQHQSGAGRGLYVLGPHRIRRDEESRQAWTRRSGRRARLRRRRHDGRAIRQGAVRQRPDRGGHRRRPSRSREESGRGRRPTTPKRRASQATDGRHEGRRICGRRFRGLGSELRVCQFQSSAKAARSSSSDCSAAA